VARLLQQHENVTLDTVAAHPGRSRLLRVQVGPFPDEASATAAQHRLEARTRQASVR
jgi:cell division septation protein DedD